MTALPLIVFDVNETLLDLQTMELLAKLRGLSEKLQRD